ncbi:MAG: hypothetical protein IKD37_04960 [Clostridia bacterium]|nr:hypothetical protein [Clostridia bacterium]
MKQNRIWHKPTVLAVSLILILTASVGGTLAVLLARTEPVVNLFQPTSVECVLNEQNGCYTFTNTGTTEAYVRVAVVANWTKNGSIYGLKPLTAGDYTVVGWEMKDGYYYCSTPIAPGGTTPALLVEPTGMAPEGCILAVEVLAEALQSKPAQAVIEAWGFIPGK